jgi:hypothetical protein
MTEDKRPWKRKRPAGGATTPLTAEWRHKARERARKAGRRYPNLVDNMWAAAQQKRGQSDVRDDRRLRCRERSRAPGPQSGAAYPTFTAIIVASSN